MQRRRGRRIDERADVGACNRIDAVAIDAPALQRRDIAPVEFGEALLGERCRGAELAGAESRRRAIARFQKQFGSGEAGVQRKRAAELHPLDDESRLRSDARGVLHHGRQIPIAARRERDD